MSRFLTPLDAREIDEFEGLWELLAPLAYDSALLDKVIVVPQGYRTDFASVPRFAGAYLLYGGRGNKAGALHDYLYSTQMVDRKTCDKVLREAMIATGYSKLTAAAFYAAVRVGGGSHWNQPNQPQTPAVEAWMQQAGG